MLKQFPVDLQSIRKQYPVDGQSSICEHFPNISLTIRRRSADDPQTTPRQFSVPIVCGSSVSSNDPQWLSDAKIKTTSSSSGEANTESVATCLPRYPLRQLLTCCYDLCDHVLK